MKNNKIKIGMIFLLGVLLITLSSAYMRTSQYGQSSAYSSSLGLTWDPDSSMCEAGQDFIIQIAPFGCTPAVVRSDLLEEQNVPVFCQLGATKINPLIDIEAIDYLSFSGKYPKEISGIGYHPAQAALGFDKKIGSPILNNIGYVVIVLKKQDNSSEMPEFVQGNLTAKIRYDIENAYGIGKASFYLPELEEAEWERNKVQYGFWDSRAYLRTESVGIDSAKIGVYDDMRRIKIVELKKAQTSDEIFLPGFDCLAGLKLRLDGFENPDTRAKLEINGEIVEIAKGEKFLENRCWIINNIEKKGLFQEVKIKCHEDDGWKSFDLSVSPNINMKVGDIEKEYGTGDLIENTSYYVGRIELKGFGDSQELSVFLCSDKDCLNKNDIEEIKKGDSDTIEKIKVEFIGFKEPKNSDIPGGDKKENYENAMKDYETIINSFAHEKYPEESLETIGETAFFNAIELTYSLEQKKKVYDLCIDFKSKFPDSKYITGLYSSNGKCSELQLANSGKSDENVIMNNVIKNIKLKDVYEPGFEDFGAVVSVQGKGRFELMKNEIKYLDENAKDEYIQLLDIIDAGTRSTATNEYKNSVRVKVKLKITNTANTPDTFIEGTYTLNQDVADSFKSATTLKLEEINLKKSAKVSVIPSIRNAETEANFSFKIGIEQRTIKLSPEKTKEKIDTLNKSIEDWEDKSEKLGKVVKGLKSACLATGAFLTVKNFFSNTGGKAIARQEVMKDVWEKKCADAIKSGEINKEIKTYKTLAECYNDQSENIDKDVEFRAGIIETQNEGIKKLQTNCKAETTNWFGERTINDNVFMKCYTEQVQKCLNNNNKIKTLTDPLNEKNSITIDEELTKTLSYESWKTGFYSIDELRRIELACLSLAEESSLNELDRGNLYTKLTEVDKLTKESVEIASLAEKLKSVYSGKINSYGTKDSIKGVYTGESITSKEIVGVKLNETDNQQKPINHPIEILNLDSKQYVFLLKQTKGEEYIADKAYEYETFENDVIYVGDEKPEIAKQFSSFTKVDKSFYNNQYVSSRGEATPCLRYYETEPYKELPAVIPFDLKNGWYVYVAQTLPITGGIASYEASGRVSSFWICNVGKNGIEERKAGDDDCQLINSVTGQPNVFSELGATEAALLIKRANEAVNTASNIKNKKIGEKVRISSQAVGVKICGSAADVPEMQCYNFMSPSDCKLLFNLCDPVVCPSSRCNYGGTYYVKDVIQSGIIGSVLLCLPNFREGIYIPVCLSGIKAGIDGWISVLKSYRDCLQESLDTGKMIGICDEIYGIHACEFFWRQSLPLVKMIIPKTMEWVLGQNVRGGGEYLGVASAWTNAENSIDYFAQYYAASSYQAFKGRIVEGVGDAVCKNSISGVYPEGGDLLDSLTDPDSPPQFHGRFDEIPFTTATNPPISQYKVYYHIYAGETSRAYYNVYLQGDSGDSLYQDTASRRVVASGYIATGEYASETKDFTAPSGYKKLCINVNGQEECGFKQVSTSFAVDWVKDQYIKEQAGETNVKTEKECVSGSSSLYSLITPSIEGAADEIINPAIYERGIIRICATANPGKGTDSSRWTEVGYCGDTNIKCWLDGESVKDAVEFNSTAGDILKNVQDDFLEKLKDEGKYFPDFEKEVKNIKELYDEKKFTEIIAKIDESYLAQAFFNNEQAKIILLRADAYAKLAKPESAKVVVVAGDKTGTTTNEINNGIEKTTSQELNCQLELGGEIIKIAQEISSNEKIDDKIIKQKTGAKNFECLILQIAMQESNIQHCKYTTEEYGGCLYCDNDVQEVLKGGDEKSTGIMQINLNAHPSMIDNAYNFEKNVKYGINYLIDNYNPEITKFYRCRNKNYQGWKRALRYYNGWNTDCSVGNSYYVEEVLGEKLRVGNENVSQMVKELFPECKEDFEIQIEIEIPNEDSGIFTDGFDIYLKKINDEKIIIGKINYNDDKRLIIINDAKIISIINGLKEKNSNEINGLIGFKHAWALCNKISLIESTSLFYEGGKINKKKIVDDSVRFNSCGIFEEN